MSTRLSLPAVATTPATGAPRFRTALPDRWNELWGPQPASPLARRQLRDLQFASRDLAETVSLRSDLASKLGPLVGSKHLRAYPVHRWFAYKEAYSPALPSTVLDALALSGPLVVADTFGGVGTTALALRHDERVAAVHSVEWSPLAQFVGTTKLAWPELEPALLERAITRALGYPARAIAPPELATFANPEIFAPDTLRALLSVREHIRGLRGLRDAERNFLLLGLAAVVEDCSGAMKDGRALRILRGRSRIPSSLATVRDRTGGVRRVLETQWHAMLGDLRLLQAHRSTVRAVPAWHLRGDARDLSDLALPDGSVAMPPRSVDAFIYSPPYLNAIDYSEIYKLELWFLEFLTSQQQFRELREGTLRSHPSIQFSDRGYFDGLDSDAVDLVGAISTWVGTWSARKENGPVVRQYFEDMYRVLAEQHRTLRPGGVAVCVVANSTYARRDKDPHGAAEEQWRIPLLTDVLLAHLAYAAGFERVEIWEARDLRPRNVRRGRARESLIVARKG